MLDLEWERPVETLRGCSALPMPVIYGAVFEWFENFLTFLGKENPDSKYQLFLLQAAEWECNLQQLERGVVSSCHKSQIPTDSTLQEK